MMKPSWSGTLHLIRQAGVLAGGAILLVAGLLILRALFSSPLAEAATNTYHPNFCLGGWENPDAAAGEPGKSAPHGGGAAAYLAPDVFAQIFCGYFPVDEREKPPKAAKVKFNFSLSGASVPDKQEPEEDSSESSSEEGGGGSGEPEEPVEETPTEENPPQEETPPSSDEPEEVSEEPAPEETAPETESSSESSFEETSFLDFLIPRAHAEEPEEELLLVSYSFDGVRWYAVGRVNRSNAHDFSIDVPANMWSDLKNLQVTVAPLPLSGERPKVYLESLTLSVEADLTLGEIASDGAAAVGGVIGEVLGVTDDLQAAAIEFIAPKPIMQPNLPPPPVKKTALSFELAGEAVAVEGAGKAPPEVDISSDGLTLRVDGACPSPYYVILTYRSIEDFTEKPRAFVSNYADECRGAGFHSAMKHLPVNTEPGVYYLLVAAQGNEGSWKPVSSLLPIRIGHTEVLEEAP